MRDRCGVEEHLTRDRSTHCLAWHLKHVQLRVIRLVLVVRARFELVVCVSMFRLVMGTIAVVIEGLFVHMLGVMGATVVLVSLSPFQEAQR